MAVAIYVRVSTGLQVTEGHSLDVQEEACVAKAKEMGFQDHQIEIFREEGYSGEDIDRPALNRLLDRIKQNDITHIIFKHPDRLSRNMSDKAIVVREFQQANIKLVFVDVPDWDQSDEAELLFNIIGSIAQYELRQIRRRTIGGKLKAVRQGQVMPMGYSPYGYDYKDGKLLLNEAEAGFVRKVYRWYVYDQLPMRQIGERLSQEGAIPKNGKTKNWGQTSILRMLTSEIYVGRYYYNKKKTKKLKGEKTKSNKPKVRYEIRDRDEWIMVEVPAIVDEELFRLAQEQRVKNRRVGGNVKREYLLRGLIRCGHCGRKWSATAYNGRNGKKYLCYRCPIVRKYGSNVTQCVTTSIRSDELDGYVWDQIVQVFSNPNDYIDYLSNQSNSLINDLEEAIRLIHKQLQAHYTAREKVIQMFEDGFIDRDEMRQRMNDRQTEISKLENQKAELQSQIDEYLQRGNSVSQLHEIANQITSRLKERDSLTFELKRQIVELLIDEVVLTFHDDKIHITSYGFLDDLKRAQMAASELACSIDSCSRYVDNRIVKRRTVIWHLSGEMGQA